MTTNTKKKKTAREKRVIVASLIVAAVMIGGSTFAWFTSKDEVTNRLSASADYGVSIVEDFTPPENLTPGQTVNKDVSVVNTGNIDALVRVQLENMLKIKNYSRVALTDGLDTVDEYVMSDGTKKYELAPEENAAYELKNFQITYPAIPTDYTAVELSSKEYTDSNGNKHANEVSLIQAGGELVVMAGRAVDVKDQAVKSGDDSNPDYSGSDQYKPIETGLYIFRRTYYENDGTNSGYDGRIVRYSGYWYNSDTKKYYALVTDETATGSTVYLPVGAVIEGPAETGTVVTELHNIQIKTTKETAPKDTYNKLSWEFGTFTDADKEIGWTAVASDETSSATHIKLTYAGDDTAAAATTDDVVFYITLADNWSDKWTYIDDDVAPKVGENTIGNAIGHFYLKDDLEAGATSPKLITEVKMSKDVTQQAYVDLTYDINVVLDSVQITFDEDGNEIVPGGASIGGKNSSTADSNATSGVLGAKAQVTTRTSGEIDAISWTKS